MNNFEDNQQKGPPPYETTVDSNTNVDGIPQTTEKYESYPPLSQPSNNPEHMPQTLPIVIGASVFGPRSCTMTCFNCNKAIVTETHTRAGLLAYTICGILLLFGCWLGCCLIPFCVKDCLDVNHTCPNCKILLGSYKKI